MNVISLQGTGGHPVLINADRIRDVRHDWSTGNSRLVVTDSETYSVTETIEDIKEKLLALGTVA